MNAGAPTGKGRSNLGLPSLRNQLFYLVILSKIKEIRASRGQSKSSPSLALPEHRCFDKVRTAQESSPMHKLIYGASSLDVKHPAKIEISSTNQ